MHCSLVAAKANARSRLILKAFLSHDPFILTREFTTYVRPLLEYCSPVWLPCLKKDIDIIENVQRAFTRRLFIYCRLSPVCYEDRLTYLGLQRLELRRIYADLTVMFKITHGMIASTLTPILRYALNKNTRGHKYKLFINRCNKLVFKNFFINRVAPLWNFLPNNCFTNDTLYSFKSSIHTVNFDDYLK